jgi:hypothetical protein
MKSKKYIISSLSAFLFASVIAGCNGNSKKNTDHPNLPEEVKTVAIAILNDSPSQFASAVNYPIERPYPLRDVNDSAEMVKYYPTLIDDSLKNKVKESPDSLWQQEGWRGWTLDNGSLFWIDNGKIYSIDYVSEREKELLDSLRREEISTLEPTLRQGWVPVLCIVDSIDGIIFRIDSEENIDSSKMRLAGYEPHKSLSEMPTLLLYGGMNTEGSMNNRFYHFRDSIGNSAEYSPDVLDNDTIPVIEVNHRGKHKKYKVKKGYWLDYTNARKHEPAYDGIKPDSTPGDSSRTGGFRQ